MLTPPPVHCRPQAYDLFAAQAPIMHLTGALVHGAVAIAMHEMLDADPAAVDAQLDALAERIRARVRSASPQALLAHAHQVLFEEEGFTGAAQDYYSPFNSYLPAVLETRRGIPITLTLVYKAVLERLGMTVHGINAPGHFLAAVQVASPGAAGGAASSGSSSEPPPTPPVPPMLVDCFYGGRSMSRIEAFTRIDEIAGRPVPRLDDLLSLADHRQWLGRMLQNLQNIFGYTGRSDDLAAMIEMRRLLDNQP